MDRRSACRPAVLLPAHDRDVSGRTGQCSICRPPSASTVRHCTPTDGDTIRAEHLQRHGATARDGIPAPGAETAVISRPGQPKPADHTARPDFILERRTPDRARPDLT